MYERYLSKILLTPRTKINGYIFDVYLSIQHQLTNQVTEHPTQYGANISDHVLNMPDRLTFQIGMSDSSQDIIPNQFSQSAFSKLSNFTWLEGGTLKENAQFNSEVVTAPFKDIYTKYRIDNTFFSSRSVSAFNVLKAMKTAGTTFECTTRLGTYKDMVIENIVANDDNTTAHGLMATVTCRQVFITTVQKVTVRSTYQKVDTTNLGTQNATQLESVIHQKQGLVNALTGIIGT